MEEDTSCAIKKVFRSYSRGESAAKCKEKQRWEAKLRDPPTAETQAGFWKPGPGECFAD